MLIHTGIRGFVPIYNVFSGGPDGKKSACNAGDLGSVPGLGILCWMPVSVGDDGWAE